MNVSVDTSVSFSLRADADRSLSLCAAVGRRGAGCAGGEGVEPDSEAVGTVNLSCLKVDQKYTKSLYHK